MKPRRLTLAQKICRYLPPIFSQRVRTLIYPKEIAFTDDYEFTVSAQTGSTFTNRTSDFHAYPFSVHGYFDWRNIAICCAVCSKGDSLIEVGGNIGTETISFADLVGKNGKVFVFEPLPSNVDILKKIIINNIILYPYAVSNRCGKIVFTEPSTKNSSGTGHIRGKNEKIKNNILEIESVTLDSLKEKMGRIRIIFIDVEGAEFLVLEGGEKIIREWNPFIVLEASPKLLFKMGYCLHDLHTMLTNWNYSVYKIGRFGLITPSLNNSSSACNWIGIPPGAYYNKKKIHSYILKCGLLPCIPGINPISHRKGM